MDKKRLYTQADLDAYAETIKRECEQMLLRQRARIDELRVSLRAAEKKIADFEGQKDRVYRAINAALKKADDIERVSIIKYNQEIAQLKSFHNKWVSYFNKILAAYPLDEDLIAASKASGRIAEVLGRIPDLDARYDEEREKLIDSIEEENAAIADATEIEETPMPPSLSQKEEAAPPSQDDFAADRSPAGFSFAEALHPKGDLKDIMRELGIIIDDD